MRRSALAHSFPPVQGIKEKDLPRLAIRPYPQHYVSSWKLKDGSPIVIRPIRPEDEPMIVKFHEVLSETSVHFRYFGLVKLEKRVSHDRLVRICFNDYDREIAIVGIRNAPETANMRMTFALLTNSIAFVPRYRSPFLSQKRKTWQSSINLRLADEQRRADW